MITKTYLDGKLNQLEEKLKKRIDMKDDRQTEEINTKIINLKNAIALEKEKAAENKDIIENYLKEHNNVKLELEELKRKVKEFEKIVEKKSDIKIKEEESDIITSDF